MPLDPRIGLSYRPVQYVDAGTALSLAELSERRKQNMFNQNMQIVQQANLNALAAYDEASGDDKDRLKAAQGARNDYLDTLWKSGRGTALGWNQAGLDQAKGIPFSYNQAVMSALPPEKAMEVMGRQRAIQAAEGRPATISESLPGKQQTLDIAVPGSGQGMSSEAQIQGSTRGTYDDLYDQADQIEEKARRARLSGPYGEKVAENYEKQGASLRRQADSMRLRTLQEQKLEEIDKPRLALAVQRTANTNQPLPDEVARVLGHAVANGDFAIASGLARNQVAKNQVLTETVRALDGQGLTDEQKALKINAAHAAFSGAMQTQRTMGVRAAQMEIPAEELKEFIPLAEKAINNVPRTSFVPWNKLIQLYDTNRADPAQRQLYVATQTVLNAYSQVVARGGISVHAQEQAEKLLTSADSGPAYKAALQFMWQEAEKGRVAISKAQGNAVKRMMGGGIVEEPYPGVKQETAPNSGGYKRRRQTATNPSTGERLESTDDGKTWHPLK